METYLFYFFDRSGELCQVDRSENDDDAKACGDAARRLEGQDNFGHVEVCDEAHGLICRIDKADGSRSI